MPSQNFQVSSAPITNQNSRVSVTGGQTQRKDKGLQSILQNTGQVGGIDLTRNLYSNAYINSLTADAAETPTPQVAPITFKDLGLKAGQELFLNEASKNISNTANTAIAGLDNNFKNKLLPQIASNAQDTKFVTGMQMGETTLATPEFSTRNRSLIQNADAVAQQQIMASYNDFANSITQAMNQAQGQQINLLGQANQMSQQNEAMQFQKDQFITQARGILQVDGKSTGEETLAKQQFDFGKDTTLAGLTGYMFDDGQQTGQRTLQGQQFDEGIRQYEQNFEFSKDQFLTGATGDLYQQGASTGQRTIQGQGFDQQTELNRENLTALRNQNDITAKTKDLYVQALQDQYKLQSTQAQLSLDNYNQMRNLMAEVNSINSGQNPEKTKQLQDQFGSAFSLYYGIGTNMDDKGNITIQGNYDDKAVSEKGLFLNTNFNGSGYENIKKNMPEGEAPDEKLTRQITDILQNGNTPEALNKIAMQSDDGNVVLLALKTTDSKGITGYNFKSVNMRNLNETEKNQLKNELGNLNTKDPNILNNADKAIQKYLGKYQSPIPMYQNLTAQQFMSAFASDDLQIGGVGVKDNNFIGPTSRNQRIANATFKQARDNKMTKDLPNNLVLLSTILSGVSSRGFNNLVSTGAIEVNKDGMGFNANKLQNAFDTRIRDSLNRETEGNFINVLNSEKFLPIIQDKFKKDEKNGGFDDQTKAYLTVLRDTRKIIKSQVGDSYTKNVNQGFLIGVNGSRMSRDQAWALDKILENL